MRHDRGILATIRANRLLWTDSPYRAIPQTPEITGSVLAIPEALAAIVVDPEYVPVPLARKGALKKIEKGLQEALAIARNETGAVTSIPPVPEAAIEVPAGAESTEIKVKPIVKRKAPTPKAVVGKVKKKAKR